MNVLSLFSGIGGLELGLERAGMTTVGQVEINPFCRSVLAKHWPDVPRHDDVRTAVQWWESEERPSVDLICGGFPCTNVSNAGGREGITGPQSSLWKPMRDVIRAVRPRYVIVENVAALFVRGFDVVLGDLHEIGLDAEWSVVSACTTGAPHTRERVFVVAYPSGLGRERWRGDGTQAESLEPQGCGEELVRSWPAEPDSLRVAYGLPDRVDRLTALGNAVVPQVSELVGRRLMAVPA